MADGQSGVCPHLVNQVHDALREIKKKRYRELAVITTVMHTYLRIGTNINWNVANSA